jgi:hypothetical protein
VTDATIKKPAKSRERFALRVRKGGFDVADASTQLRLRAKRYHLGDLVFATITKPRNPLFHRLVHRFGTLISNNIEAFSGVDAHQVLKRLQIEANVGCDEVGVNFPGIGNCVYRIPRSLSFESMDEGEFSELFTAFARYVSEAYWPGLTPQQIIEMARAMPEVET